MTNLSVAMCVCNGQAFLEAQLSSILAQTHQPVELIILDDRSSDNTCAIVEQFAERAPFPVRLHRNPARLGPSANFARAITLCTGDVIALADQDDVWKPEKLARLSDALSGSASLAAFSDAEVVAENQEKLGYTMWQRVRFNPQEQRKVALGRAFEVLLKHSIVTGATLALKVSLRNTAIPIPPSWPHDAWLATIAAAQDGLVAVGEPLIEYRQHAENLVGGQIKSIWQEMAAALDIDRAAWYRDEIGRYRALAERLATLPAAASTQWALAEKIAHLENRANLPTSRWRRLPGVLREITAGRYDRHARNWGSIAIDLLVK